MLQHQKIGRSCWEGILMTSPHPKKILIVEDEPDIAELVRHYLEKEGFHLSIARTGPEALTLAGSTRPNLMILDLMLPQMDGLEVCKTLRQKPETAQLPIIMLTAKKEEADTVVGLELGADDYVTKPFDAKELLARLRAIQRRAPANEPHAYFQTGPLAIDFNAHVVTVKGEEIKLTPTEFSLLRVLALNAGKVVTHQHLLREVWGPNAADQAQYLRVYMNHLRKKIELPQSKQKLLKTESGIGYRLLLTEER